MQYKSDGTVAKEPNNQVKAHRLAEARFSLFLTLSAIYTEEDEEKKKMKEPKK